VAGRWAAFASPPIEGEVYPPSLWRARAVYTTALCDRHNAAPNSGPFMNEIGVERTLFQSTPIAAPLPFQMAKGRLSLLFIHRLEGGQKSLSIW